MTKETDIVIIGAGPVGLFAVHQLGIIGLKCDAKRIIPSLLIWSKNV